MINFSVESLKGCRLAISHNGGDWCSVEGPYVLPLGSLEIRINGTTTQIDVHEDRAVTPFGELGPQGALQIHVEEDILFSWLGDQTNVWNSIDILNGF